MVGEKCAVWDDTQCVSFAFVVSMIEDSQPFLPGVVINGKYRLERELGRGGMGAVYEAYNVFLDAPVAIKMLHPGYRPSGSVVGRFAQEARAAAQVRHANIVSILDVGQDDATGALFIVQEYLPGIDLKRHLAKVGTLTPREAIELLLPVMRALAHAHSKNVVHRDLKPDNIFLCETPDGIVPKIIDFGIAKVLDEQGQSPQNTRTASVLGTPHYMSPEQASGDRAIDHRTDIWSLGVVLFQTLTGRRPHEGTTANLIVTSIIARQPTPITTYAPALPQGVVELVHGALQYDPSQRFQSMKVFEEHARSCLAALSATSHVDARTLASHVPLHLPSEPPSFLQSGTIAPHVFATDVAQQNRKSARWFVGALLVLVVVSVLAGVAFVRSKDAAPASHVSTQRALVVAAPPPSVSSTSVQEPVSEVLPDVVLPPITTSAQVLVPSRSVVRAPTVRTPTQPPRRRGPPTISRDFDTRGERLRVPPANAPMTAY
jgi:serine/threonine protein kinase